jgi:excisionase family DNA binding protein
MLSVYEVALLLCVSERTVWRMLEDGQLPRVRIRGITRIPAEAVERLMSGT